MVWKNAGQMRTLQSSILLCRDGSSKNVDPEAGQAAGTSRVSVDGKPTSRNSLTSMKLSEAGVDSGMVLPFEPMIMTFSDVHYFVPCPPVPSLRSG